jgi:hypothetical protein
MGRLVANIKEIKIKWPNVVAMIPHIVFFGS